MLNKIFKPFGYELVKRRNYSNLLASCKMNQKELGDIFIPILSSNLLDNNWKSQIGQDLIVMLHNDFKKGGYFVEFGATDGVLHSNTHALEKTYGWQGILAEPGLPWHEDLKRNRACAIDFSCVWRSTGEMLDFNSVDLPSLSTIKEFSDSDYHSENRKAGETYKVESISLMDLLEKHDAPTQIDYLSIDTEGSEYEILNAFDFDRYDIRIITCEHNFSPNREKIHDLLARNGYQRRFTTLSKFDDWYFR